MKLLLNKHLNFRVKIQCLVMFFGMIFVILFWLLEMENMYRWITFIGNTDRYLVFISEDKRLFEI